MATVPPHLIYRVSRLYSSDVNDEADLNGSLTHVLIQLQSVVCKTFCRNTCMQFNAA